MAIPRVKISVLTGYRIGKEKLYAPCISANRKTPQNMAHTHPERRKFLIKRGRDGVSEVYSKGITSVDRESARRSIWPDPPHVANPMETP